MNIIALPSWTLAKAGSPQYAHQIYIDDKVEPNGMLFLNNQRLQSSSLLNGSIIAATAVAAGMRARSGITVTCDGIAS